MTNEELKNMPSIIDTLLDEAITDSTRQKVKDKLTEVCKLAIKALEAPNCIEDYPTCTECEHYDSEKHYCPRFCQVIKDTLAEAQPSEDCISRQKALDCFEQTNTRQGAKYAIETLPSVTPQRPKGKWIHWTDDYKDYCTCSECGYGEEGEVLLKDKTPYCPYCGSYNGGNDNGDE